MKKYLPQIRKFGLAILIALFLFGLLNLQYFWKNLSYMIRKPAPQVTQAVDEKGDPNFLTISSIGVKVPVVYVDQKSETVFQKALQSGVVHYPGTALPGQAGNVYIFGHSSDYAWVKSNYKSVFALLPRMKIGDMIQITDADGKIFEYRVTETKVIVPTDLSVLAQDTSKHLLTLQTSYPVGTALKRYLVIAELK